jgi:hypothetical protein
MWCQNIKYSTNCFAIIFNIKLFYLGLNKRNLENGFQQFILRGMDGWMDGWMDVFHSRRHRRSLLFCAIAVSFSPIAVVFFSDSAGLFLREEWGAFGAFEGAETLA